MLWLKPQWICSVLFVIEYAKYLLTGASPERSGAALEHSGELRSHSGALWTTPESAGATPERCEPLRSAPETINICYQKGDNWLLFRPLKLGVVLVFHLIYMPVFRLNISYWMAEFGRDSRCRLGVRSVCENKQQTNNKVSQISSKIVYKYCIFKCLLIFLRCIY